MTDEQLLEIVKKGFEIAKFDYSNLSENDARMFHTDFINTVYRFGRDYQSALAVIGDMASASST